MREHASLTAVLRSLIMMIELGPGDQPSRFFDVMRAMLFYIDEFPEKQHHPKESALLFPKVVMRVPETSAALDRLSREHQAGEEKIRELEHALIAWELMGESRRLDFEKRLRRYVEFYLEHMKVEETVLLPAARAHFTAADWRELDEAFADNVDLFDPTGRAGGVYDRLFTRIVTNAPAPVGVGVTSRR